MSFVSPKSKLGRDVVTIFCGNQCYFLSWKITAIMHRYAEKFL